MRITFLGAGELTDALCRSLVASGHPASQLRVWARSLDDAARGQKARALKRDLGIAVSVDLAEAMAQSDWIMSGVSGSQVCAVATAVAACGPRRGWYFDLNSSDPSDARRAAALLEPLGWRFLDGGVMGPAPLAGHRTPMVLSGAQARPAAEELGAAGFNVRVVGDQPGEASALKLLRNLVGKNFAAVVIEALVAAELLGLRNHMEAYILEALQMDDPAVRVNRWVSGTILHAARRLKEHNDSAALVEQAGGFSRMTRGACTLLEDILALDLPRDRSGQDAASATIERLARAVREREDR